MASIQKRGATYQYTVSRMVNGQSKPIRKGGFRTKKEAQVAAAEVEAQINRGIVPHLKPVPFDEYFIKWVRLYKSNLSITTQKHYQYTYKAINAYFASKSIQEIKRHDYQHFLNDYGSNKSKETVEKLNSHIRACVKDAIEEQIIFHDFTRKAVLNWTIPEKKPVDKHLDYNESKVLFKELRKRINEGLSYSLLFLGLTSGMRFAELVGLTWDDFDFTENTITINKTWGYMKRNPEGFGPTKNEQSNRTIRMDKLTMNHFRSLQNVNMMNVHKLVFYSPSSKYKVISNTAANNVLKKLLRELNIEPISIHGLRHTHASILLYKKVSIYYVSERLGHSDIETTLKEYTHLTKELRKEDEHGTIITFEQMSV
ncbi:tyrosine-type recombinase/integrase [Alkalihalophilus marmarensis]|uniref:tyrosine-type recombinase/integrase n=1 Tax=Alkalihalophilus marmarensis TaxID=521377 RepID=UPI002E1A0B0B|nr:tyrosine-type recombinase/integrase [Alkalihalophilus marmarensis]MED1601207.1 tyrosine-type recombinase/integrase [Alkalihalophilus marmarensis]